MGPARELRSSLVGKALLLVGSTVLTVLVLEGVARLLHQKPWYEQLVEEQRASTFRFRTSYGNLRDRTYASPKPSGHRRILLLGDSFTVGQGVRNRDDIFAEILERRLNEPSLPTGVKRIDILNGGLGGSLTGQWLELYKRVEDPFDPDVVVAIFFLRDGTRTGTGAGFFGPVRHEIAERNRNSLAYRNLYLYRFFRDRGDRSLVASRYLEVFQNSYFGDERQTREWRQAQRNLLELRDLANARSAKFGLVVFPVLADLDAEAYPFGSISNEVISFGVENGMAVHDLLPAFRGLHGPDLWVSAYDQHPNETAHQLAAESLLPFFSDLLEQVLGPANP